MPTKYIENTTASPLFVGGKLIPPGEGRDIDVALLPPEHQPGPAAPLEQAEPTLADLVEALRAQAVKAIAAELPGLTNEALDLLEQAEAGQKSPRKGVHDAIAAERLRRASAQLQAEADQLTEAQLAALTPEQRAALGDVVNP